MDPGGDSLGIATSFLRDCVSRKWCQPDPQQSRALPSHRRRAVLLPPRRRRHRRQRPVQRQGPGVGELLQCPPTPWRSWRADSLRTPPAEGPDSSVSGLRQLHAEASCCCRPRRTRPTGCTTVRSSPRCPARVRSCHKDGDRKVACARDTGPCCAVVPADWHSPDGQQPGFTQGRRRRSRTTAEGAVWRCTSGPCSCWP